ncbi:MAG TPA: BatA and WFA domain-containing protein [Candidatus Atribacteria bacterium]|nr:BatA and WFA domain-containing protein [Candidatus Atribacteria bacterium]HPT77615.1 BatA and WFA domain-containing protein [Candidatus Atribacteria bacterium]
MSFLNPWGLTAALLVVPVILLYILKQQYTDVHLPSTMLWQQVHRDLRAVRPWQRLRTHLLLLLQLLAVLLFALSLARPVFVSRVGGVHYIVVVDSSARMQAVDVKPSRMEAARQGLLDLISGMGLNDTMTVIQAGIEPYVAVNQTGDKAMLRSAARELSALNSRSDLDKALQLASAISSDGENGEVHVFTDTGGQYGDEVKLHLYGGRGNNVAVANVSAGKQDKSVIALTTIVNYGADARLNIELKVDGYVYSIKEISLPEGGHENIYWTGIPEDAKTIEAVIAEEDDLAIDNRGFAVVEEESRLSVLLVADRNVFIEKALGLRADIELYKTNPGEEPAGQDFPLYIYDGYAPVELPKAHMLIFNPPEGTKPGLASKEEFVPGKVRKNANTLHEDLLRYTEPGDYQIAKAKRLTVPEGFDVLLEDADSEPLLIAGEIDGRKTAVFAFSLHDSNLPVKADFPILMQGLINWMLPPSGNKLPHVYAGEPLALEPLPDADSIWVIAPSGRKYEFDVYPRPVFYDTYEPGIFEIVQTAGGKTHRSYFAVSVETGLVSDLRSNMGEQPGRGPDRTAAIGYRIEDLWTYAGLVLVLLLLTEWWVYHNDI